MIVACIKCTYYLLPQFVKGKTHDLLMAGMRAMVAEISDKGLWTK